MIRAALIAMVLLTGCAGDNDDSAGTSPSNTVADDSLVPEDIRDACRAFISAHDEAAAQADTNNQAVDLRKMAHPHRVNEFWSDDHQDALERAARAVAHRQVPETVDINDWDDVADEWTALAYAIIDTAEAMRDYYGSSAERGSALSRLQIACVGR